MKILTLKLKPKMIFGIILALTGIVIVALSFGSNHLKKTESVSAVVSASTDEERRDYLATYGWELSDDCEEKVLTIPEKWDSVYNSYNEVQMTQGFDLSDYKGKTVELYTYSITNYEGLTEGIVADMLVCDGTLIGGDVCNTSADNGFLVGFNGEQ
jgi:hypothetical protein